MTAYALVMVLLISLFIARFSVSSVDHALGTRLMLFEQQARQGAEAGLEIALRLATATFTIEPASFVMTLDTRSTATLTVIYEITAGGVGMGSLFASATAWVRVQSNDPDPGYPSDPFSREVARRTVWNRIDGNGAKRMTGAWGTP